MAMLGISPEEVNNVVGNASMHIVSKILSIYVRTNLKLPCEWYLWQCPDIQTGVALKVLNLFGPRIDPYIREAQRAEPPFSQSAHALYVHGNTIVELSLFTEGGAAFDSWLDHHIFPLLDEVEKHL